jgi:hypothetical protein
MQTGGGGKTFTFNFTFKQQGKTLIAYGSSAAAS